MKLKYYMRGVGVGIIFTAIIFIAIILPKEKEMSDAEIRIAAKALGMVDGGKEQLPLSPTQNPKDLTQSPAPPVSGAAVTSKPAITSGAAVTSGAAITPKPTVTSGTSEPKLTATPKVTPTVPKDVVPTKEVTPTQPELVYTSIKIEAGMSSEMVAEQAKSKGLVLDNEEFNRYLVEKNYSDFISIGSFQIPEGSNYKEIAEIITGEPE